VPFGELAWDHARRSLGRQATEEQIADAVTALLRRASRGPQDQEKPKMSRRDRRVAARTKAAAPPGRRDQPDPGQPGLAPDREEQDAPTAKVIPLPIFDPFAEADKRW
jgi:hypothetical protein